ncbi:MULTISPECIES: hypothetical protein [Streptomyces]|uniref:hypothetical protein n=1 Tax=Streptomyces TaxID=1883 RepID=UPI001F2030F4|nr:hypothetical protein [Streptomyces sp. AS58]
MLIVDADRTERHALLFSVVDIPHALGEIPHPAVNRVRTAYAPPSISPRLTKPTPVEGACTP